MGDVALLATIVLVQSWRATMLAIIPRPDLKCCCSLRLPTLMLVSVWISSPRDEHSPFPLWVSFTLLLRCLPLGEHCCSSGCLSQVPSTISLLQCEMVLLPPGRALFAHFKCQHLCLTRASFFSFMRPSTLPFHSTRPKDEIHIPSIVLAFSRALLLFRVLVQNCEHSLLIPCVTCEMMSLHNPARDVVAHSMRVVVAWHGSSTLYLFQVPALTLASSILFFLSHGQVLPLYSRASFTFLL